MREHRYQREGANEHNTGVGAQKGKSYRLEPSRLDTNSIAMTGISCSCCKAVPLRPLLGQAPTCVALAQDPTIWWLWHRTRSPLREPCYSRQRRMFF